MSVCVCVCVFVCVCVVCMCVRVYVGVGGVDGCGGCLCSSVWGVGVFVGVCVDVGEWM